MSLSVDRTLRKARRLAKSGSFDLAAREYQRILERFPENKRARDGLRAVQQARTEGRTNNDSSSEERINRLIELFNDGKLEEALSRGAALAKRYPDEPFFPNLLGAANASLGRLAPAEKYYTEALRLRPDYAEAHNNLGLVLYQRGKLDEAVASCRKALELKPDYADAYNNLGNMLNDLGDYDEAVASYEKALAIRPDYAEAHGNLGNALNNLGDSEAAIASFEKALKLNPSYAEAYSNMGAALNDLGRPHEAVASFEKALRIRPDFAAARNSLGAALKALGKFEEAIASYHEALRIKEDFCEAHLNLSMVKEYRDGDFQIEEMLRLIERDDLPDKDRMRLSFALGKAHDDLRDYDKAFAYLEVGNRLRKRALGYELSASETMFSHIRSIFSSDIAPLSPPRDGDETDVPTPIFVLGMPRSGTTVVEQILAAHSRVYAAGELELLSRAISAIVRSTTRPSIDQLRAIREAYLSGLRGIGAAERFITDKLPLNFLWIGYIATALPEAKIVHVKRDPRATCWSNFKHYFSRRGTGFSNDLRDIAEFYLMYAELMEFWHAKFPGKIYDLGYESLTEHQKPETERLLEHVGLNVEARCMDFHEVDRSVRTASATQVRKRMYRGSSEAWRRYEKHLAPMLQVLGFARD